MLDREAQRSGRWISVLFTGGIQVQMYQDRYWKVQVHNNSYCTQSIDLGVWQDDLRITGVVLAFTSINLTKYPQPKCNF
jgi:hypothetical protein